MATRAWIPLVLTAALAACSGDGNGTNPFAVNTAEPAPDDTGDDDEAPPTAAGVPASLAGDVDQMIFDRATQTLVVRGLSLDEVPVSATYTRRSDLDATYAGYKVYTAQDDPLDRHVTALFLESAGSGFNGQVRAGIAVTGGPRNRYFGGGYYERDGDFDAPAISRTSGMVSYAGDYVGLTNIDARDGMLLEVDPATPIELRPARAAQITGKIFLNADFADNRVEGNVYNRVLVPRGQTMPSLVLLATDIDQDGVFAGDVEFDSYQTDPELRDIGQTVGNDVGDYGGLFGGPDAAAVAGIVRLEAVDGSNNIRGYEGEEEYGVFVLGKCGTSGATSPVCDDVRR